MIRDQADELRQLALRNAAGQKDRHGPRTPLVVVAGGKGGVGSTTVAVNLAAGLALNGHRTLLIDADFSGADAAAMCGLDASHGLVDVLSGQRDLHEVLLPGPAGMQVLPGAWPSDSMRECSANSHSRLIDLMQQTGNHLDLAVLDAGNGIHRASGQFWQLADVLMLVTKPDDVSVMDTYAAVKASLPRDCPCPVLTVVNRAHDYSEAEKVHQRLAYACQRFLGRRISAAGHMEEEIHIQQASAARSPLVLYRPESMAAAALIHLAKSVAERLARQRGPNPFPKSPRTENVMTAG